MQSLLVTGGAGFIGSAFVRSIVERRTCERLAVLDKLTYAGSLASLESVQSRITFVRGEIGDRALVSHLLAEHRPEAIVNFAAESHVDRSIDIPAPFVMTNVVGTAQLLEASLDYWRSLDESGRERFRFLHISTDEVFGSIDAPELANENSPYNPSSPYAASKAAGDHFVQAFHRTYSLPTIITYSTNNYGPYQFPEKLVPIVILNALEGKPIPLYGDGEHRRDWLHVDDHCEALRLALDRGQPGESFCVTSGVGYTNRELIAALCAAVDEQCPSVPHRPTVDLIQRVADRPGHDRRYALDSHRIEAHGWKPRISIEDGLVETVAWYRHHLPWVMEVCSNFNRQERMGLR